MTHDATSSCSAPTASHSFPQLLTGCVDTEETPISTTPEEMTVYRGPGAGSWGCKTSSLAYGGGALAKPGGQVATAAGPQGVDGPQDTAQVQLLVSTTAAPVWPVAVAVYGCSQICGKTWEFELVLGQLPAMIIARHLCYADAAGVAAKAFLQHKGGCTICAVTS